MGLLAPVLVSEERKQIPEVQARADELGGGVRGWSKAVNERYNPATGIFKHGKKAIDAGKRDDWRTAGKETTHSAVSVAQTLALAEGGATLAEGAAARVAGPRAASVAKAEGAAARVAGPRAAASVAKAEGAAARAAGPRATSAAESAAAREAAHGQEVLAKVRDVNAVNKGVPFNNQHNCVSCSIAADKTMAGTPSRAINTGKLFEPDLLAHYPGRQLAQVSGYGEIETTMRNAGPGARGIVLADRSPAEGHAINVVNHKGTVVFVDAQTGRIGDLPPYKRLLLLRTN